MAKNKHYPDISVELHDESDTFATVIAEPFEKGYGITIGNALRRVLKTSIPGVAITSAKIEGVAHEFTTVEGIVEDIPDVVLNLKQVRFKVVEGDPELVTIELKGPGEFTAKDITEQSSSFEVLNPEHKICTLMESADLSIDIRISRGKGYTLAQSNKVKDAPLGTIALDSIFNPVTDVSWEVAPIPTSTEGHERLVMEVTTDGSTSPKDAVNHAAKIIRNQISLFMFNDSSAIQAVNEDEINEAMEVKSVLEKSIDEMELSVRSYNCLQAAGIRYIGELVEKEESEMLRYKNFGRKSLTELVEKLSSMGLHFGMDTAPFIGEKD
ncbi:MAG: DNA-directed RNA polymerase subunit alpha [Candidatus Marinimicrobia bacterium]|jgi:DNA-directed RNA polymerase subunit alpha|nr:DNA-directed RNA polymerase subunit alpha [Candidatus Neomarinimicrobiota bacterium]MBT3683080.1 DNA-directed RNA polymerase subunit alpha [Candidatus Neomarinimicrobiota bacterium]MBT3759828.1 DNA-directed RNA polymerase subunit alpha [Candidatus Neomarinimicrobiota bacterium]MBT3895719.1 DNA-directed RNA polymerase subunit alpha [Candidatus Neomarinimicrobiota bacterium]MBT4173242.1 DNA-directed RNA polymerase subunit alpha [Candidatus Neomarinimicrobiota bacterium]